MFSARSVGHLIAGKVWYGAACLGAAVILVVAGYAHKVIGYTTALGKGIAIAGSPSFGAMNILVMGLESRTNYQGQQLDHHMQVLLHSGSVGSQDTNTLILIHIFADGKKAVGFSIPRDDLVTYPQTYDGQTQGKIDGAYAYAYYQYISENTGKESNSDLYLNANKAGQAATLATVQAVTGQKIDHFMEVNLDGFYYLAQAFNGIEVCIQPAPASLEPGGMPAGTNLTDKDPLTNTDNSGFDAFADGYNAKKGGTQYLHLDPAQSLAFVRSRDTLPGVDVGRTHRQQATLDYVIYELKHAGLLTDFGKLNSLLGTAGQYLITDSTFNLLDFATDMRALSGQALGFSTLPFRPENNVTVPGYSTPQDVNIIDISTIKQIVKNAFDPAPPAAKSSAATGKGAAGASTSGPPPSSVTVDVYNGNPNASGLARQVSQALVTRGYKAGAVANALAQSQTVGTSTRVFYGAGASANASELATEFGTSATALQSLPAGHVEVLIGSTVTQVPAGLATSATATAGTQSVTAQVIGGRSSAPASTAATDSAATTSGGGSNGTVTVSPNAKYGIPCVY
jgi:anionic cell wall polymer biosynthesis LytR-Cps2A-Psr (LCP) family protein